MKPTLVVLLLASVASVASAEPAHVALDYRAADKTCPAADRFADEVSAKLGFVPWDAQASAAIRIRITRDGGELVGTVEQPGGASQVLRAGACAQLGEQLVSAVAVALDRGQVLASVTGAPLAGSEPPQRQGERRLRRLEAAPNDGSVDVALRSADGRQLEISRVTGAATWAGYSGGYTSTAAAISYEKLCTAPCTAKLPAGENTLVIHDLATNASITADTKVNVSSTLDLHYTSKAANRHATSRRTGWGLLIGTVVGAVAFGYIMETSTSDMPWALHFLDPLIGFSSTGLIGATVGYFAGPRDHTDEARIDVHPGLATAWNF